MRFARIGRRGHEVPAAAGDDGVWHDVSALTSPGGEAELLARAGSLDLAGLPVLEPGRFGPPLSRIGKIVCIGLNYAEHVKESGAKMPAEPIVFMKAPDTVMGATDPILIPRGSTKTDWEVELGVVIGRKARYLAGPEEALAHVGGYVLVNDVSERAFQLERGGQWDKGKNCETFTPLGPWILSADEVPDPQDLWLKLWVNAELKQDGTTADMVFGVAHIVWYLSQFMVLYPGDVIATGTPPGVALGSPDPRYLRPGDLVELEGNGLGRQRSLLEA
jgi:2-keto-4-pentenoate hydratase/2-oxohepta-3-ene-1,7-dioic acid hydratase in catechol pathway